MNVVKYFIPHLYGSGRLLCYIGRRRPPLMNWSSPLMLSTSSIEVAIYLSFIFNGFTSLIVWYQGGVWQKVDSPIIDSTGKCVKQWRKHWHKTPMGFHCGLFYGGISRTRPRDSMTKRNKPSLRFDGLCPSTLCTYKRAIKNFINFVEIEDITTLIARRLDKLANQYIENFY